MNTRRVRPSEAAARHELAVVRGRLVALLRRIVGPRLTTKAAQAILAKAKA
ncbi:hypothetical protein ACFYO0_45180 [Streptomyces sp. NPDC006365]|uniref:hypothetical protein n=1 Tax=Streptomyces sp. NPDC006365 TaxID=3364744 RepID=UPI0036771537